MFNTVTPDAMSEGSPRMMIIIFLVICNVMYVYPDPGNGYVGMGGEHFKFQSIVT